MAEENDILVLEDDTKDTPYTNIVSYVNGRFERAKNKRYSDEERWTTGIQKLPWMCMVLMFSLQKLRSPEYLLK